MGKTKIIFTGEVSIDKSNGDPKIKFKVFNNDGKTFEPKFGIINNLDGKELISSSYTNRDDFCINSAYTKIDPNKVIPGTLTFVVGHKNPIYNLSIELRFDLFENEKMRLHWKKMYTVDNTTYVLGSTPESMMDFDNTTKLNFAVFTENNELPAYIILSSDDINFIEGLNEGYELFAKEGKSNCDIIPITRFSGKIAKTKTVYTQETTIDQIELV